jgi:hypothetical protein
MQRAGFIWDRPLSEVWLDPAKMTSPILGQVANFQFLASSGPSHANPKKKNGAEVSAPFVILNSG